MVRSFSFEDAMSSLAESKRRRSGNLHEQAGGMMRWILKPLVLARSVYRSRAIGIHRVGGPVLPESLCSEYMGVLVDILNGLKKDKDRLFCK